MPGELERPPLLRPERRLILALQRVGAEGLLEGVQGLLVLAALAPGRRDPAIRVDTWRRVSNLLVEAERVFVAADELLQVGELELHL